MRQRLTGDSRVFSARRMPSWLMLRREYWCRARTPSRKVNEAEGG